MKKRRLKCQRERAGARAKGFGGSRKLVVRQAAQLPKRLPKVAVFVSAASLKRNRVADVSPAGACRASLRNLRLTFFSRKSSETAGSQASRFRT